MIEIVRDIAALRAAIRAWRGKGLKVALVPTMGALHAGHASLVTRALTKTDRVVATVFVNPTQFNSATDLAAYPRTKSSDAATLTKAGAHLLFAPDAATMYPPGHATTVTVAGLTDVLCGAHRPGHFTGVATIVTKLLLQALPDIAVFGEKDYQQLLVIRRLAADLDIPVVIDGAPTRREADGLAMSSRNARLTPDERKIAPTLYAAISKAASAITGGAPVAPALGAAHAQVAAAGFGTIDYIEARAEADLEPVSDAQVKGRVFAAAHLGEARLIDNVTI